MMNDIIEINKSFARQFEQNEKQLGSSLPEYIGHLRKDAIDNFIRTGLPEKNDEAYKHFAITRAFKPDYNMQLAPTKIDFNVEDIFKCDVPNLNTRLEIILNGFYVFRDEPLAELENGILIGSLAAALKKYPDLTKHHYAKYADYKNSGLVALNTAFAQDGLFVYLPRSAELPHPIQIVHLPMIGMDTMLQYRNLIILEENSYGEIIVCDHTLSPFRFLTNSVTEIYAGKNSQIDYTRIQNEHLNSNLITNLYINQERDSRVTTNSITLHGGMVRNNIHVVLNAEGCENNTYGLFFADRDQHIDNFVNIDHAKPNCMSRQLFKGILDDKATGAFNGRIIVRKDAQKTNAFQTNNNILLTDEARMNSKPQLEIYADDVKCSHGATTGQLDENALFYMRSRGIPLSEARLLLLYAFVREVFDKINIKPLQERIDHLVNQRLRGELSRCNNCPTNCGEIQSHEK
jgi:Fe-S cluster assembly protein SufD